MTSYDLFAQPWVDVDLMVQEGRLNRFGHAERKSLRQAERAEEAFRASRGYEPATLWGRLRRKLGR